MSRHLHLHLHLHLSPLQVWTHTSHPLFLPPQNLVAVANYHIPTHPAQSQQQTTSRHLLYTMEQPITLASLRATKQRRRDAAKRQALTAAHGAELATAFVSLSIDVSSLARC
jgi:hypothetical protein